MFRLVYHAQQLRQHGLEFRLVEVAQRQLKLDKVVLNLEREPSQREIEKLAKRAVQVLRVVLHEAGVVHQLRRFYIVARVLPERDADREAVVLDFFCVRAKENVRGLLKDLAFFDRVL